MSINRLEKQTTANINAKANLIWEIATHLVGLFKPHEYGKVILPMTVLKRFDDALKPTKGQVLEMNKKLDSMNANNELRDGTLCKVSGYDFYNTSRFDFEKLLADPDHLDENFDNYLKGFSDNVKDIIASFKFEDQVRTISTYIWVITKGKSLDRSGKVQLIDASKCYSKRRKNIGNKRVDLTEDCISLIMKAYEGFEDVCYEDNDIIVESKVFDNSFFGFTKVTVETAQTDENGELILKKGKKQPVKGASDTEVIPLHEDISAYMEKNVLPYNPLAYINETKDKVGYEVPFTRLFYKFEAPESSDSIFEQIKALEAEETILMKELFGNA